MADEETQSAQGGESWEQKYSDVMVKLAELSTQLQANDQSQQTSAVVKLQQQVEKLQAEAQSLREKLERLSSQPSPAKPTENEPKPGNDGKPNEPSGTKPGTTPGNTPGETKPEAAKPAQPAAKPLHRRRSI